MTYGRAGHLVRTILLLAAVVMAFIIASAAIRYNHQAGLFDAHPSKPASGGPPPKSNHKVAYRAGGIR